MSKSLFVVLVFAASAASAAIAADLREARQTKYTTRFDNVNIDEVLRNDRLLNHYFKCLTVEGHRCSADGLELKRALPDALKNGCTKCSQRQQIGTEKVIRYLIDNKPDMWLKLEEKYDPTGEYRAKYRSTAKQVYNIQV